MITSSEINRKLIHLLNMIIPLGYLLIIPDQNTMTLVLIFIMLIFIAIDIGRNRNLFIKTLFEKYFNSMLRDHEKNGRLTGASWVMIVSVPMIYFFPKEVAVLSLIFMSIGDVAAALVGQSFGKIKIRQKTLEGSIGCFVACAITGIILDLLPLKVMITGALAASLFEALPVKIDDNILIPLGAGTSMLIMSSFF